ncbi:MAG: glycosyltransferase family 1 protein [Chlorobi bacterium]|nr:glycosyltransferase family 1 protein [Chlorobiota bacterium]
MLNKIKKICEKACPSVYYRVQKTYWHILGLPHTVSGTYTNFKKQISDYLKIQKNIRSIISRANQTGHMVIYPYNINWNVALYQRPHHFANFISQKGIPFVFVTDDKLNPFFWVNQNLLVIDESYYNHLLKSIGKHKKNKLKTFLLLPSTNPFITTDDILKLKNDGFGLIYDYIDKIDEEISPQNIDLQLRRHKDILNMGLADLVLCVSDLLYKEALEYMPPEKVLLIENAVDYNHFHISRDPNNVPSRLKSIVEQKKPIIGYYGAIAPWIDIDLINEVASRRKDWNFVLIGPDYDGQTTKKIKKLQNIHYLGPVDYQELPNYAIWFDVATIPFKRGEIAKTTSPIKLYEYMALNKPIVSTADMDECKKYRSPLIAHDTNDFILQIERALQLKDDPEYLRLVDEEARRNTWEARVERIIQALR